MVSFCAPRWRAAEDQRIAAHGAADQRGGAHDEAARGHGPPHAARAAPSNRRASAEVDVDGGARASSVRATRSACCRRWNEAGHARTTGKSRPCPTASSHRPSVRQRVPGSTQSLVRRRTSHADRPKTPKSQQAWPIAIAPKCRRATTPRGTTRITAPQRRHLYRRAMTSWVFGGASGVTAPRTCRTRSPWPTSPSGQPAGRPAAPHAGQRPGRARSGEGGSCLQELTSRSE